MGVHNGSKLRFVFLTSPLAKFVPLHEIVQKNADEPMLRQLPSIFHGYATFAKGQQLQKQLIIY
jgi:hypothetical protein